MIKYRTRHNRITAVEIIRETSKSVVYLEKQFVIGGGEDKFVERKSRKSGEYENWHDTWDAAKEFLIEYASVEVNYAQRILDMKKSALQNAKGLKQ